MAQLRSNVVAARQRLLEGHQRLRQRHLDGSPGTEVCRLTTALHDDVVRELFEAALADLGEDGSGGLHRGVALVAHGGYGRRDVAPFSDVDLMVLHNRAVTDRVAPLADRLLRDVFDASLVLGHSVRTPDQAVRLGIADASICTSLAESRLLAGSSDLLHGFTRRFQRQVQQRARTLIGAIDRARLEERLRYGETVFLLEPNIKRSAGTLRDLQLIRWIGFVRYGTADPQQLCDQKVLTPEDLAVIQQSSEFLLRLRNELHFHAGRAVDVLDRAEQLRIAAARGYQPGPGLLPVEQFMREYFRHTNQVSHLVERLLRKAQSRQQVVRLATAMFGHRVEGGVRVGPAGLVADRQGLRLLEGNLTEIMRLVALANLYDKPIAPLTWEYVRYEASRLPDGLPPAACHRFLSLLAHPGRLGSLLRDLHEAGILERFIPEFEHARGLLQFNQYHKYTVDEHSFRAVEFATDLATDEGTLGRVYRSIRQKHLLHLALLLHDLGKGCEGDHCDVGARIAREAAERLALSPREAETVEFLVQQHLLMNHLAFRRDTGDEQLIVRFAADVGSPEVLRMLFIMTAADFAAVGPDVWDGWKEQILTGLFHNTMQCLAGDSPATILEEQLRRQRRQVDRQLGPEADEPWFVRQLDSLPASYLNTTEPDQVAGDLRLLNGLPAGAVEADIVYQPDTDMLQVTVATREDVTPGIFHKLTGALAGGGLEIRSAQINTFSDALVLDRFWVFDPDYNGESPSHRLDELKEALVGSLHEGGGRQPKFRRLWNASSGAPQSPDHQTRVRADNSTSETYTILDIFTRDRPGLLYAVARTLFELELSVARAKIGTYVDQVVDVFYVTDRQGDKIEDQPRLEEVRRRLLEVIEAEEEG